MAYAGTEAVENNTLRESCTALSPVQKLVNWNKLILRELRKMPKPLKQLKVQLSI